MNKYLVNSYFSSSTFSIKQVYEEFSIGICRKRESSFLLFELGDNSYFYIKDYGGVAFFNVDKKQTAEVKSELNAKFNLVFKDLEESINVIVSNDDRATNFDEIIVNNIDIETVHITCLNMAQSVTLFHYQDLANGLLENARKYTTELEEKGKVSLKRKELMKYIGSTLNIKNKISENLYVFDSPMIAWENEDIAKIDHNLNEELEIKYRYNAIKEQLNITQENLELFRDMNMHQHSSNLEWIIIWLIVFEVVHILIDEFFNR